MMMYACLILIILKGALAWNGDMLSSGSRDRLILQRDARSSNPVERRLIGHRQEVNCEYTLKCYWILRE